MQEVDPALMMFISACCAKCADKTCDGALEVISRAKCKKYNAWQKLSGEARTKLFAKALAGEFINLERIVYEGNKERY